jgi:hypothetical protein
MLQAFPRTERFLAAACTCLLALGFLAPRPATAACGHHDSAIVHLDGLARFGALADVVVLGPEHRPTPTDPCALGACGPSRPIPVAPPAIPPTPHERWTCLLPSPKPPIVRSGLWVAEDLLPDARPALDTIERPPRREAYSSPI